MAHIFANASPTGMMSVGASFGCSVLDFVRSHAARSLCRLRLALVSSILDRTRRAQVVGIDPAQAFIDYSRTRFPDARVIFDCGSAGKLPYPDASFDHALSLLVFQFLQQPGTAACEMRRVTRTGGTVAVCTWDKAGQEMSDVFWEECVRLDPGEEKPAGRRFASDRATLGTWRATVSRVAESLSNANRLHLLR